MTTAIIAQSLAEAFQQVLDRSDLPYTVPQLLAFAEEDRFGGRDTGHFPKLMSPYAVEGQFLYAMVRALRPEVCLEIGCADGGSATHMLAALQVNGYGKLMSVDINERAGLMIPAGLKSRWELLVGDAREIELPQAQFVFEDSDHSYATTRTVLNRTKEMQPQCIVVHDYFWEIGVGDAVDEVWGNDAIRMSLAENPIKTGMACWIR